MRNDGLKGLVERRRAQGREKREESGERSWSRDKSCVYVLRNGGKESQREFFFTFIYFMKL